MQREETQTTCTEFSFILKPSVLGGIGVFATHDIPRNTPLFSASPSPRRMKTKDIPTDFIKYCIFVNDDECLCPERFDRIGTGWYIKHSCDPNIGKNPRVLSQFVILKLGKKFY